MKTFGKTGLYLTTVTIPKSSKFVFGENKKVIGKFKDEAAGKPILEFVGLTSKMYSYITEEKKQ